MLVPNTQGLCRTRRRFDLAYVALSCHKSFSDSVGVMQVSAATDMRASVSGFPGQEIGTAIEASVLGPTTALILDEFGRGVRVGGIKHWKIGQGRHVDVDYVDSVKCGDSGSEGWGFSDP